MSPETFVSYAQNGEDVVLFRALGGLSEGRYVDVGANDPTQDSITLAFYERGWSGITVEPVHEYAERHRAQRPRDTLVEAAVTESASGTVVLHQIADTGLSSVVDGVGGAHRDEGWTVLDVVVPARQLDDILAEAGWDGRDIQFIVIDTEGAERAVLDTIDLHRWRPWVLVIEATEPNTTTPSHEAWEPQVLAAGYRFCLFDGLSRFYVAQEREADLGPALSYPTCVHDTFVTPRDLEGQAQLAGVREQLVAAQEQAARLPELSTERDGLEADRDRLAGELVQLRGRESQAVASAVRWRQKAVETWAQASAGGSSADHAELVFLREHAHALFTELGALKKTVSWRVTAPLRGVRRLSPRRRGA